MYQPCGTYSLYLFDIGKILGWSKMKGFAEDKLDIAQMTEL